MKKQGFTLILFLVTSLFLLTQSVLAVNQFIFSASASDGYVETYSSSSSQPTLTTNKTFTIRIEFNDTLQSNLFVEKQSNFANWNGTESINSQGKVWTFSNVPPGNYFFKVLVGQFKTALDGSHKCVIDVIEGLTSTFKVATAFAQTPLSPPPQPNCPTKTLK